MKLDGSNEPSRLTSQKEIQPSAAVGERERERIDNEFAMSF